MKPGTQYQFRIGLPYWRMWDGDKSWVVLPSSKGKHAVYYSTTYNSYSFKLPLNWTL